MPRRPWLGGGGQGAMLDPGRQREPGLPEDYELARDLRVTMPMHGRADSLNAAVAGAMLAYEVLAKLRDKPLAPFRGRGIGERRTA